MEALKITVIFFLLSSLNYETVQGFATGRIREVASTLDAPESVQQLSNTLTNILQAVQKGVQGSKLKKALTSIAEQADKILQEAGSSISDQDARNLIAGLSTEYQPLLDTTLDLGIKRLDLAFELLNDLADKLRTDNDDLYVIVAAIGKTAAEIAENAEKVERLYIHIFNEISKRQNPGWSLDGNGLSHTWKHGDGSSTKLGAKLGYNKDSGLNGDVYGSHTFKVGAGKVTLGGHLGGSSEGVNGGISGSVNWNNGRTSLGGNLDFDSSGRPSGGIEFTHRFKGRMIAEQ